MNIEKHEILKVKLDKIKRLSFNRDTNLRQVNAIAKSISDNGILRLPVCVKTRVIDGTEGLYLIDGQHLTAALVKVDEKAIDCIVVKTNSLERIVEMMAVLNNINLKWTLIDYVNAYMALGKKDYFQLKNHSIKHNLNITVSGEILKGSSVKYRDIRKGCFLSKAVDSDEVTKNLNDFITASGLNAAKAQQAYIRFIRSLGRAYRHESFLRKLKEALIGETNKSLPHDTMFLYNYFHEINK